MILITGLGNPGKEFLKTRHNVGFDIVDSIHSEFNFPKFSEKFNSLYSKKTLYGEPVADICVESQSAFKPINCPTKLNSAAIDEFLLIFLVAAKANGISYFKNLAELNQKESPRLKWGSKILNKIGIRNIVTKDTIKIYSIARFGDNFRDMQKGIKNMSQILKKMT